MSDLTISSAATLTGANLAVGDLFPVLDISATDGSKGSRITTAELRKGLGVNQILTPQQYGAVGDAQWVTGVTVSGNTVTSPYAIFSSADTGKVAYLASAGYQPSSLRTLVYVSSTQATLSGASLTTYTGGDLVFATQDDTTAIRACFTAAWAISGPHKTAKIVIPAGGYLISSYVLDLYNASGQAWGPEVIGAGKRRTNFFISPDYAWNSLGYGNAVVTNHNQCNGTISGFSIIGNFVDPGVGYSVTNFSQAGSLILDSIEVRNFRGGASASIYTTSKGVIRNCHIENNVGYGITVDQVGNLDIYDTYHGNGTNTPGLQIYNSKVRLFAGVQDESTTYNILVTGSSELHAFGAQIEGLAGAYALRVEGTSKVRLFGSNLRPFADHNNSGSIDIASGATVFAAGCQIKGLGTRYAILNAGTFEDGGGNSIEGTGISSSGTLRGVQGAAVADATDAASVITQLNALLSRLRTRGDIAT